MSYETPLDVMLGLYGKLLKQRDRQTNQLAEIELTLKLCDYDGDVPSGLEEDLRKKRNEIKDKLWKTEKQLELLQKKRNGGASLDPFLSDEVLQKTEDKLNEDLAEKGQHCEIRRDLGAFDESEEKEETE